MVLGGPRSFGDAVQPIDAAEEDLARGESDGRTKVVVELVGRHDFQLRPSLEDKGPAVDVETIDLATGCPGRGPEFTGAIQSLTVVLLASERVLAADNAAVLLQHIDASLIQQRRRHSSAAG